MHSVLGTLIAQAGDVPGAEDAGMGLLGQHLVAALAFSLLGLVILALCIWFMCRFAPVSRREGD